MGASQLKLERKSDKLVSEQAGLIGPLELQIFEQLLSKTKGMKDYYRARANFWKVITWFVPIVLGIVIVFWVYELSNMAEPIGEMKAEVKHLKKEDEKLGAQIKKLEVKLKEEKRKLSHI